MRSPDPHDPADLREAKRALRRRVIRARDAVDAASRDAWSEAIASRLMARPELQRARTVHLFAGFGSEVDTLRIVRRLLETGRRPVLPVVLRETWTMEHAVVSALDDLAPGFKGILEPAVSCPRVGPGEIDLVIVPGVAFDRTGRRLGYGGGFYDRFLAACPAPRIALAFALQVVEEVPCDDCDLPVDRVITEEEEIPGAAGRATGRA
ncbi:MAG: 5-formyltetrahydrofolate cyclo-ligase [Deltaproteobacteria bacterium]|nr:5-formyltetrahydrofolate cyclo-ligase [Deltaproteobacteria bacterium]